MPGTQTMKAAVWSGSSPHLDVQLIAIPTPRAGEALVKVRSCGVCHTDLHVMKSEVAFPAPAVLGHEISGTVVSFGEGTIDTAGLSVGDDIVGSFIMPCGTCDDCRHGRDDMCTKFFEMNRLRGVLYDGESRLSTADGTPLAMYSMAGLAEYAVVPVTALAASHTKDPSAAVLGCAVMTSYGALSRAAALRAGETVAVVAVGGVGQSTVRVAKALGASTIIAVDVDDEKLEAAIRAGATHAVNSMREDPVAAVKTITDGRGVDVSVEALGLPATFTTATKLLAAGGRMVAVGIAAGNATAEVEITPLVRRGQTIVGSFGARPRTDLPAVVSLSISGAIDTRAIVTRRYTLDAVNEAYTDLDNGHITGRALIVFDD